MEEKRRYEIDGLVIEIPLIYDGEQGIWLEDYAEIIDRPKRTPDGYPIVTCADDACRYADNGISDCGSCPYYHPAGENTLMGICKNEIHRKEYHGGN